MPARIAHIRRDALANMRTAVQRNYTSLVNHFIANHHDAGSLDDFVAKIVKRREHALDHAARDAAAVNIKILPGVHFVGEVAAGAESTSLRLVGRFSLRSHRWNSTVRRIHNQRGLTDRLAALYPIGRRIDGDVAAL